MPKNTTKFLILRCTQDDLDIFDAAALKGRYTHMRADRANRSAWSLAVLRVAAEDAVGMKTEAFVKTLPKRKKRNALRKAPVKSRA